MLCSKKRDRLTVIALFVAAILLCIGLIDQGHEWGDDFAAYLLEARAITNDTMQEQAKINRKIHAFYTTFGGNEDTEEIVYVWGYPLLLSGIYRAIGYEWENGMPIAYKIPGVIAQGLLTVILFAFYRRRFSYGISLFLTITMALNARMLLYSNELATDILCLMLSMAALLMIEIFLKMIDGRRKLALGLLLGAVLWYNYEVRLNGVTIIFVVAATHALWLLKERPSRRELPMHAVPYVMLLALLGVSLLLMPQATENTSHIASGPNSQILYNIRWYDGQISGWIENMLPAWIPGREYARLVLYALIAVGVLRFGIMQNFPLTALMGGTFAVVYLLPYVQSIRYLFNALPLMLMFAVYGVAAIWQKIGRKLPSVCARLACAAGYAVMLMIVCTVLLNTADEIRIHQERGGMTYRYEAYSDEALDIYAYIRENTPQDAQIGCVKSRALTLNTDRIGFVPGINSNRYKDMDYLLSITDKTLHDSVTESIWPELWNELTEVYRNDKFVLYELSEAYRLSE